MSHVDPERVFASGKIVFKNDIFAIFLFHQDGTCFFFQQGITNLLNIESVYKIYSAIKL